MAAPGGWEAPALWALLAVWVAMAGQGGRILQAGLAAGTGGMAVRAWLCGLPTVCVYVPWAWRRAVGPALERRLFGGHHLGGRRLGGYLLEVRSPRQIGCHDGFRHRFFDHFGGAFNKVILYIRRYLHDLRPVGVVDDLLLRALPGSAWVDETETPG